MEILKGFVKLKNVNLGLGLFDGVHIGHRKLINELVSISKETDSKSVVITFKNSPAEKFLPNVKYLTTLAEKEVLLSGLGIDYLLELDFDDELMQMSAEDYLKTLYDYFQPNHIVTGFNHTFGRGKIGNNNLLKIYQEKYNYIYNEIPPVKDGSDIVSSTLIRETLEKGDLERGNRLLGSMYKISGKVIRGNQIGQKIGYPTANIDYPEIKAEIPYGVYSVGVELGNEVYRGMLNYGIKPTLNDNKSKPVAEVHILGFNRDIYGKEMSIYVHKKIRNEIKFSSLEELKIQIKRDIELC